MTDLSRWRLAEDVEIGVQRWEYISSEAAQVRPQSGPEKYFLKQPIEFMEQPTATTPTQAARNGFNFYKDLQLPDGHWGCFYGGPSFLLPGLVITSYITHSPIPEPQRLQMIKFLHHSVNDDGGWGMHFDGPSTVFGTCLYYVSGRILGIAASDPLSVNARDKLLSMGGPTSIPQWGKFWLASLGLFGWDGINPVPSEFWLLPDWMPIHPWRWWIHTRVVYLPMSYLFSNRLTMPPNDLTNSLKEELYEGHYDAIDFSEHRNNVSAHDLLKPHSAILRVINWILVLWFTYLRPRWLNNKANELVVKLIAREDQNTNYACLAPVNKALQMLANFYIYGRDSEQMQRHREKVWDYMWLSDTGMTSSGTNGVQLWDTAFSISALYEASLDTDIAFHESLAKGLDFLDKSQFRDDSDDPYRQQRKGGWPFSTKDNGYIVSDCLAEGMKSVLLLQASGTFGKPISDQRIFDGMDTMLTMQNSDGGFASYELVRASHLLELLNPAEVFDRIMTEYCYVECTSACYSTMTLFSSLYPQYRAAQFALARKRAIAFVKTQQRSDGSFYGSWGICFTYGTMFAVEALALEGGTYTTSREIRKAVEFLLSKQMDDGGWGESYLSSENEVYTHSSRSLVVQSSWALIALILSKPPASVVGAIERGVELLMSRQAKTGEWPQEDTEGVFNRTCMIGYPNYRHYFPIKALGMYVKHIRGGTR
ncbi:Lanosterol synthase [Taphrina deformans PYCC 5710]|uniref:Terpene cyclase/mutase family member n=1 Tax=Taphrina deformans (strain PYCC 5710 / ATCC 11124 / CBS 356.35 / IMI 108563 / JCM 9778 / NBRC 8474) TaxID=1097556 RepID=R4X9H2_TAPDE|nr:Lanosterol synthase [Taphrina deformans PYCC 5710]|eukprot:CCG80869.1 Lanosterol synthase [Taphrina deformans PYCC 5710]